MDSNPRVPRGLIWAEFGPRLAPIRPRKSAVDPPLVVFRHVPVYTVSGAFGGLIGLAGFKGITKQSHDLVGILFRPRRMHFFVEVATDQVGDVAEYWARDRINMGNAEVGVYQVDP